MSDELKDFIKDNRGGFDDLEPADLWTKIDASLKQKPSLFNPKNITNMLKYGFGASALVVGTLFLVNLPEENNKTDKGTEISTPVIRDSQPLLFKTPRLIKTDILPTAEKKEKSSGPVEEQVTGAAPYGAMSSAATKDTIVPVTPGNLPAPAPGQTYAYTPGFTKRSDQDSGYKRIDTLFKNVKYIKIDGDFCDVTVKAHAGNEVLFHGSIGEGTGSYIMFGLKGIQRSEHNIHFEKTDSVLKVWIGTNKINKKVRLSDTKETKSVLDFKVPAGTGLEVMNNSGDVVVEGVENKRMLLQTSFGRIVAENLKTDLVLRSSSGNITAAHILGDVRTENSFGNQVLESISGNVNLRCSSGNITLKKVGGNADVTSSFGDQRFEEISGKISAVSSSGEVFVKHHKGDINIRSSFGSQYYENVEGTIIAKSSSGNIKMTGATGSLILSAGFGDIIGKDIRLTGNSEFRTSSGDIAMNLLNEMKELKFDLTSSSGDLRIEKENQKNESDQKLMVGTGAILVKGVSSFGDQKYR